jgi:methylated-DNA-[protein]-cysteine S-methyltransferase
MAPPAQSYTTVASPVGELLLVSDGVALTGLYPTAHREGPTVAGARRDDAWFAGVRDQLSAYFRGRLTAFEVLVRLDGTPFQRGVWKALTRIPCGTTRSSASVARELLRPTASRAVGTAVGKNPVSLIIPCHRVLGAAGALTGQAGGLELQRWLLAHEAAMQHARPSLEATAVA